MFCIISTISLPILVPFNIHEVVPVLFSIPLVSRACFNTCIRRFQYLSVSLPTLTSFPFLNLQPRFTSTQVTSSTYPLHDEELWGKKRVIQLSHFKKGLMQGGRG